MWDAFLKVYASKNVKSKLPWIEIMIKQMQTDQFEVNIKELKF